MAYPSSTVIFTRVVNGQDTVQDYHVNLAYVEIEAIEQAVGSNPTIKSSWATSGFSNTTLNFDSLTSRIVNIETGTNYAVTYLVKNNGGTKITPANNGDVGLAIQAKSGSSANLFEVQNSSSTTAVSYFKSDGTFYTPIIDGGTA